MAERVTWWQEAVTEAVGWPMAFAVAGLVVLALWARGRS